MQDATCSVEDCQRQDLKGSVQPPLCGMHYQRWKKHGTTELAERVPLICSIEGCPRLRNAGSGAGMCAAHYARYKRHGDPQAGAPITERRYETTLKEMSPTDLAWLAGWLEGEGSFSVGGRARWPNIQIVAASVDEDVVRHAHDITGVGKLYVRPPRGGLQKQTQLSWAVSVKCDVRALLDALLPHMHSRRAARITELLEWAGDDYRLPSVKS